MKSTNYIIAMWSGFNDMTSVKNSIEGQGKGVYF